MKRVLLSIAIAAAVVAVPRGAVLSQGYNPFQIGASGGIAFPTGDLGDFSDTGYNIAVAVGYKPQFTPIGVRAEAAWNQFGITDADGNVSIPAFTGNLVFSMPVGTLSPYIIGGAGLYRPKIESGPFTTSDENDFGFNIGGGIKIPLSSSFETFVEARYHHVNVDNGSLSFVPLTVGIMF
jgi:opacity protein-like surface antigen